MRGEREPGLGMAEPTHSRWPSGTVAPLQGTPGYVWRQSGLSQLSGEYYWYVVGRGQGYC